MNARCSERTSVVVVAAPLDSWAHNEESLCSHDSSSTACLIASRVGSQDGSHEKEEFISCGGKYPFTLSAHTMKPVGNLSTRYLDLSSAYKRGWLDGRITYCSLTSDNGRLKLSMKDLGSLGCRSIARGFRHRSSHSSSLVLLHVLSLMIRRILTIALSKCTINEHNWAPQRFSILTGDNEFVMTDDRLLRYR